VDATEICRVLDARHGVALRSGYHCAQPLVTAMGFPGVARASLAPYNDDDDVDALLEGLEAIVRERGRAPVAVG
ncbi:MAG TPA: aminotransferase class V-fold PLP-dependent enzyme, partial [Candidatus Sulfotelmatobacter sp.]|nr:aminotransferase class V-fold PLP-dependent enzyme [Candidatus Sulfotelmatobacter sp.]